MDTEDELSALMHRAVATLDPPIESLVTGGMARGRRRIRRRRVGYGLSVAAVAGGLAVVTALAVTGTSPSAAPGSGQPAAGSPSSTHSLTAAERSAAARREAAAGARARRMQSARAAARRAAAQPTAMTPQALLQTALDLLPAGGTTSQYGGNGSTGFTDARFIWDDGQGAAQVEVSIVYPTGDPKAVQVEDPCAAGSPDCTVLPDGSHALVRQGAENSTDGGPNETEWDLDLVRTDGTEVNYIEFNAPAPKDERPTRAEPPFTVQQVTSWADSPTFQIRIPRSEAAAAQHLFTPDGPTPPQ